MILLLQLAAAAAATAHMGTKSFSPWRGTKESFNGCYHTQSANHVHNGENSRCHLCDHYEKRKCHGTNGIKDSNERDNNGGTMKEAHTHARRCT